MNNFTNFGLLDSLIKTLTEKRITKPTEIQNNTLPLLMSGQSVVGVSETGSGKTLAYALPMLHLLKSLEDSGEPITAESAPRAIVMVPTRELGEQVSKVFKTLTHDTRLRVRPALGGMAMEQARRNTSGMFEILLATPGRLAQLMDMDKIDLKDVRMLVFDEADQMMDQGFLADSNKVYYSCPKDVQLALFSATVSPAVQDLINDLFADAEVIRSSGSGKVVKSLTTKNLTVKDGDRWAHLDKILAQKVDGGTILFTNTREQCDKLAKDLEAKGFEVAVYRGEMEKNDRRANLKKFADGKIKLLVATDLAGRGLDIQNVDRVINFHLPRQMENYLHRAGRTARAGRKGTVINLVTERDELLINKLEGRGGKREIDSSKYNSHPRAKEKTATAKKPATAKTTAAKKINPFKKPKKKLGFQRPTAK
ncbi:DEAD/DEAH box helicase [Bdellovibrio bacteriovorus]|uniref:DEAD/DEAH box helicase n=1 Tax=Bdellovibrio bacteriovorus TaxID=959 RepID=UPI0021D13D0C|nr:DEAD/DEAH box helicase [Bdellovibrio bacteriovorus]UXR65934.1 DEAD/DEAH box helicase [Bdellovibrio bacteriovorus]